MIDLFHTSSQIHYVTNFQDLISTPFHGEINAICWTRKLTGDFSEIVKKVKLNGNITVLEQEELIALQLGEKGQLAREILLHVEMTGIVLPRDRELFRSKRPAHPEQQGIAAIGPHAIDRLFPRGLMLRDFDEHRNSSQPAKDPAWPKRVRDALIHPVLQRNPVVQLERVHPAHLNHHHDEIRVDFLRRS